MMETLTSVLEVLINGRGAKAKGAIGEREFLKAIGAELTSLGFPVPEVGFQRNLEQTRHGGFDNHNEDCLSHWAIEIRRRENLSLGAWWKDVCTKASKLERVPVIAYRQNRKPWAIALPFYIEPHQLMYPSGCDYSQYQPITMDLPCFVQLVDYIHKQQELNNAST